MFPIRDSVSRTHEPIVVWTIMGLNIAAFLYQLGLSEPQLQYFLYRHALVPRRYFSPGWGSMYGLSPTDFSPFLTNIFLHGGWLHIILNMWTLWIFGPALEDRLGPVRFAILYLLAGVAACDACLLQRRIDYARPRGVGRDFRHHRGLCRALSLCLGARAGADRVPPALLQRAGHGVRRDLVPHPGAARGDRASLALCG